MDKGFEIGNYSEQQLVDALCQIDDEKHFDNTLNIYQKYLNMKGLCFRDVSARKLGYKNNWFLEGIYMGILVVPFFNGMLLDIYIENQQMDEKIDRLNKFLAKQNPDQ